MGNMQLNQARQSIKFRPDRFTWLITSWEGLLTSDYKRFSNSQFIINFYLALHWKLTFILTWFSQSYNKWVMVLKARAIKNFNLHYYLKILSNYTREMSQKARAILREFSNITCRVNLYCAPILTITCTYWTAKGPG